ncbi:coniferyl aldehyde dehydrogenase [Shewanella sp. AS1]|uniref:coniferyl aldehyde dehydrogenase n=1 Tax=Shewanella sp. AS1 TaxID=2907626 RepID=UPI001F3AF272|nr:coniferyl aldehyde dehydrogenase [Shewanella sp. AS1]MCE9677800.1 coniferyl aldehyde dehydrogenase [Shewanella sp. AS1]
MSLHTPVAVELQPLLNKQKAYFNQRPCPDLSQRKSDLTRLKQALIAHQAELIGALSQDYGHRSPHDSVIADILPCINQINYTLKHLKSWLRPSKRHAGLLLAPAKVTVHYQPVGVVGIIVPWNFPVILALAPLITALAAGNCAMIKLSEFTPATNKVLKKLLAIAFEAKQVVTIEGEAEVAAAFSALAFDHLLFTGSTQVGRLVMAAAAKNLTPVTLELGGKSPVVIAEDMPLDTAVERLIYGKCLNAGQICVAPDYVLLPKGKTSAFIAAFRQQFYAMYGEVDKNPDYSAIINPRQFERLQSLLQDAREKGAKIHSMDDKAVDLQGRKLPPQLITQVSDEMQIMQEEIFGPLLPILEYETLDQAIDYINQRPRPLALYIMSFDSNTTEQIISQTHSGGVCVNDTLFHVAADDAPFGGIGASGMGHYHGKEGFLTLSHAKTVLSRGKFYSGKLVHPPYDNKLLQLLMKLFLR